eukprot:1194910-Prorocentrum_minimum.AAC.1
MGHKQGHKGVGVYKGVGHKGVNVPDATVQVTHVERGGLRPSHCDQCAPYTGNSALWNTGRSALWNTGRSALWNTGRVLVCCTVNEASTSPAPLNHLLDQHKA